MNLIRATALCLMIPTFAAAQVPDLNCTGTDPIWALDLFQNSAQFRYADRTIDYEIADVTVAQPGPYPIAITLLADRDTAIVLVREDGGYSVDILTQRRQLPVLFNGTCTPI